MGKEIRIRVDESLVNILARVQREVANDLKNRYGLQEIKLNNNIASRIVAGKLNGNTIFNFKVRKTGLNKGILEIL